MGRKVILKSLMITCKDATLFISKREERKLSLFERLKLLIHLAICEFCKLFEKQNKFLTLQIKQMHTDAVLSNSEKEQLQRKIEEYSFLK